MASPRAFPLPVPLPRVPRPSREGLASVAVLALLPAMALLAWALGEVYYINLASRIAILALAGVGLNLALGGGGLVSLGHAAFFGLGGYVVAIGALHALEGTALVSWPLEIGGSDSMPVLWLGGVAVAGLVAAGMGAVCLRTSGVHFIMITLAFAQMIYYFAVSWPAYGGEDGLPILIRNGFPGLDTYHAPTFFALCFAALLACLALVRHLMAARFGAALTMARLNDVRLATSGISPTPVRLAAFVVSAMITALAGALYADLNGFVGPSMLSWHRSGELMVIVILGGVGRLAGPVAGAILFIALETLLGGLTEHWSLFLGLALLAVVLFWRGGVMGLLAGRAAHD